MKDIYILGFQVGLFLSGLIIFILLMDIIIRWQRCFLYEESKMSCREIIDNLLMIKICYFFEKPYFIIENKLNKNYPPLNMYDLIGTLILFHASWLFILSAIWFLTIPILLYTCILFFLRRIIRIEKRIENIEKRKK
jgi:hypothetical protein